MTSPSDENDDIVILDEEDTITFTKEECAALLRECQHSWISYENPIAREMIRKIRNFVDNE